VEQGNLYNQYSITLAYSNAANLPVGIVRVPVYLCPAGSNLKSGNGSESFNGTPHWAPHYCAVMGPNPAFTAGAPAYPVTSAGSNSAYTQTGAMVYNTNVKLTDITDGTSNTFLAAERSQNEKTTNSYRSWTRGNNGGCGACKNASTPLNSTNYNGSNNFNDISFGSNHTSGANFGMADGSVRFVNQSIAMIPYLATASRSWGEVVTLP
jgi:prepilin-type processing-associated H-X9-DG protein